MVVHGRKRSIKCAKYFWTVSFSFLFCKAATFTGLRVKTGTFKDLDLSEPDPNSDKFLNFVRPKKCIRKCANGEKLLPANSKLESCTFTEGKFSRTWNTTSSEDFLSCQEAAQELNQEVRNFLSAPNQVKKVWDKEKGIVFSVKFSQIKLVYASIGVIREFFNSNLPIEVFVSKRDLPRCVKTMALLDTTCRVPRFGSMKRPRSRFGWKAVSIMQSSFKNILWLDADCFPLVDPKELFQDSNFRKVGAIFWPDLTGNQCDPHEVSMWPSGSSEGALWNVFNLRFNGTKWKHLQEFESGQMIINSVLHFRALTLAYFLTENGIFQQFAYGDKEAFRWSWLALDLDYHFSEYPAFLTYYNKFDRVSKQCYRLHYLHGKPVFLHGKKSSRSLAKCGYHVSHARRLNVASIHRDVNICAGGICYNETSYFCNGKTFLYVENTAPLSISLQAVEEAWESKFASDGVLD